MQTWSSVQCQTSLMFRSSWPNWFDQDWQGLGSAAWSPSAEKVGISGRGAVTAHTFDSSGFFSPKWLHQCILRKCAERKGEEGSAGIKGGGRTSWETQWCRRPALPPAGCSALPCRYSQGLAVQQPGPFTLLQWCYVVIHCYQLVVVLGFLKKLSP